VLIRALEEDARMPLAEIARRAGVSESTAGRRLARLRGSGHLQLVAIHRPWRGGSTEAIIAVGVEPAEIANVAERLSACDGIRYVAIATGAYDVLAEGIFRDNDDLNRFLQDEVFALPGVHDTTTFVVLSTKKIWGEPTYAGRAAPGTSPMSRP